MGNICKKIFFTIFIISLLVLFYRETRQGSKYVIMYAKYETYYVHSETCVGLLNKIYEYDCENSKGFFCRAKRIGTNEPVYVSEYDKDVVKIKYGKGTLGYALRKKFSREKIFENKENGTIFVGAGHEKGLNIDKKHSFFYYSDCATRIFVDTLNRIHKINLKNKLYGILNKNTSKIEKMIKIDTATDGNIFLELQISIYGNKFLD